MAVGIAFNEDYEDPKGDVVRYRHAAGWDPLPADEAPIDLRSFLAQQRPDGQKHGELFHYVSTNTDVLGWVYERACDQAYAETLCEYFWEPLGAEREPISPSTPTVRCAPPAASASRHATSPASVK